MSTHGCFAPPFFPFPFFLVVATRCWSPGARRHLRRLLPPGRSLLLRPGRRRPGVVRRIPGRRPAPFRSVSLFVLAFLRQTCLTYVCTQIYLLPLTLVLLSFCIRALEAPG